MLENLSPFSKHLIEAANHKLNEADLLLREGHIIGGCYLIGYVIEMMLKAVLYEVAPEQFRGEKLHKDFGNGHNIKAISSGLLFLLPDFEQGDYTELLHIIEDTTYPEICAWSPDWRYHQNIEGIQSNPTDFAAKLADQVYELYLEMRSLLVHIHQRRTML